MKLVTIIYVITDQKDYTTLSWDALLRNTPQDLADILVVFNEASKEVKQVVLENKRDSVLISEALVRSNYGTVLNSAIEKVKTPYLGLVHSDTIVTEGWLNKLLNVFFDYNEKYEEVEEGEEELTELVGVSPFQNYNDYRFLIYRDLDKLFCKNKPPNKIQLQKEQIIEGLDSLYPMGLESFSKRVEEVGDTLYRFIPEVSSSCLLLNFKAFKRICGHFSESFLGAGGEIRFMCRQLQRVGYFFARADLCFVHHHGNLTNDGIGMNYQKQLQLDTSLLEKTEVQ